MFIAPAHSFDINTIKALNLLKIEQISDGFFKNPIIKMGIKWIPQQLWKPKKKKNGIWTICIHPETADSAFIQDLEMFLKDSTNEFIHPNLISFNTKISLFEKAATFYLFYKFKLKITFKKMSIGCCT